MIGEGWKIVELTRNVEKFFIAREIKEWKFPEFFWLHNKICKVHAPTYFCLHSFTVHFAHIHVTILWIARQSVWVSEWGVNKDDDDEKRRRDGIKYPPCIPHDSNFILYVMIFPPTVKRFSHSITSIFPIANDQVSEKDMMMNKKREGGRVSISQWMMLQCQHFRFNVASIICEVSEMKTVFRIKTFASFSCFLKIAWLILHICTHTHTLKLICQLLPNCFDITAVLLYRILHTYTHIFAYMENSSSTSSLRDKNKKSAERKYFWAVYIESFQTWNVSININIKTATFSCN